MSQQSFTKVLFNGAAFLSALGALVALSACTINATSDEPPVLPKKFMDSKATIQGPVVEGSWVSACIPTTRGTGTRKISSIYKGETVERKTQVFTDNYCQTMQTTNIERGIFRFIESFSDGGYTIEYNIDLGGGYHSFPQEKVWVDAAGLYLSDYGIGATAPKEGAVRFTRAAGFVEGAEVELEADEIETIEQ